MYLQLLQLYNLTPNSLFLLYKKVVPLSQLAATLAYGRICRCSGLQAKNVVIAVLLLVAARSRPAPPLWGELLRIAILPTDSIICQY